ncbi:unnamed protein product [Clavelina lepadiformis]|uniref:Uncharacterized protein n=1 Tax=Clavelina lepadiformis TaxID=159417 RepID=A0ABP0GF21_CLALP
MKFFKNVECLSIGKLLDNSSDFVDKHLRRIQNTLYGLFGISLLIVGRRLRLVKQFRLLHEIPDIYIAKQISLRGRVRDVSSSGILHVQHIPVIQLPLLHVSKKQAGDAPLPTIPVKLIGTQISESQHQEAIAVLKQLIDQNVWFKMFYREPAVSSERKEVLKCLHCLVSKQNVSAMYHTISCVILILRTEHEHTVFWERCSFVKLGVIHERWSFVGS